MPKTVTPPKPSERPRVIKGSFTDVLFTLRKLGKVQLTLMTGDTPLNIDTANFTAAAFEYETVPTKYELSHGGIHIGMAYLPDAKLE
jgi:hypothetical protein